MKAIVLYTAQVDNSGARHDAGEVLQVGKAEDQILLARARELVDLRLAAAEADQAEG